MSGGSSLRIAVMVAAGVSAWNARWPDSISQRITPKAKKSQRSPTRNRVSSGVHRWSQKCFRAAHTLLASVIRARNESEAIGMKTRSADAGHRVSAHAGTEEGDSKGWGQESPHPFDSCKS